MEPELESQSMEPEPSRPSGLLFWPAHRNVNCYMPSELSKVAIQLLLASEKYRPTCTLTKIIKEWGRPYKQSALLYS